MLGFELGTAYSELVDPVVQRERLVAQAQLAARGDDEAMRLDEDFLRAMEYGMPPAGGMGMGIDRLLMALTGLGIRETILFPLVRPGVASRTVRRVVTAILLTWQASGGLLCSCIAGATLLERNVGRGQADHSQAGR